MKRLLSALMLLLLLTFSITYPAIARSAGEVKVAAQEQAQVPNRGDLTKIATSLPQPDYPPVARKAGADGQVKAEVVVDDVGQVISVNVTDGHPLLRGATVKAARQAKFAPLMIDGQPTKFKGTLTYTFVKPQ